MAFENTGDSSIIDPRGEIIAGPVRGKEMILTATINLDLVRSAKAVIDVAGHYSRPDVFELRVCGKPLKAERLRKNKPSEDDDLTTLEDDSNL